MFNLFIPRFLKTEPKKKPTKTKKPPKPKKTKKPPKPKKTSRTKKKPTKKKKPKEFKDYQTTTGHISLYWDAGKNFDVQASLGRYLAGDWGGTLEVSRRFANGWKVGTYATLTDVPFATFGEGSFDKGLFLEMPLDWLIGTKSRSQRAVIIKPITRDGGAKLVGTGQLYSLVNRDKNSEITREMGRAWK